MGKVITFYSYKGGMGTSSAVANTACLLGKQGKKVLVVDWNFQSPSQHVIFGPLVSRHFAGSENAQEAYASTPGLLELLLQLQRHLDSFLNRADGSEEDATHEFMRGIFIEHCIVPTDVEGVSLLKAGNFDKTFFNRVMSLKWEPYFNRTPYLLSAFAEHLGERFDYVLIDSQSGLGDAATICLAIMPEQIVFSSTANNGNLEGGLGKLRVAAGYRRQSSDLRPLLIFPLAFGIDNRESDMRERWFQRFEAEFLRLYSQTYAIEAGSLQPYLYQSEIPFTPWATYGEDIAALKESADSPLTLAAAYKRFVDHLVSGKTPWECGK